MNNQLQIFENQEFGKVRVIIKEGEPWFVAKDVCDCLGITNSRDALSRLDNDEKGVALTDTLGGKQEMRIVNEAGLYALVLSSKKPEAKKFKRWITHEILPTIRKTGGYVSNEDMFIETYLPFADDNIKQLFKQTLNIIRSQNRIIERQRAEIEYKEDVIIDLVDKVDLAGKREILNRVIRKAGSNYKERWNELYRQFEMKYHIDLNRRLESYNAENTPKLKNKLDYIDKVLGKLPELYEIACKLYENDIKKLVEELYILNKGMNYYDKN